MAPGPGSLAEYFDPAVRSFHDEGVRSLEAFSLYRRVIATGTPWSKGAASGFAGRLRVSEPSMPRWIDRLLTAMGLAGRKAEADVSQDPAQRGPRQEDTTLGRPPGSPPAG